MNKKGLSILLALSMVFSLNTFAFAEEATTEEATVEAVTEEAVEAATEETVDIQYDTDDTESYNAKTVSADKSSTSVNGTTIDMTVAGGDYDNGVFAYDGKKLTANDLQITLEDTSIGYAIPVSKIKITSNKKATATGEVKYKITGINNWKYLSPTTWGVGITTEEAKAAYKTIKGKLKSINNTEFTAYVAPRFIYDSISMDKFKELKKKKGVSSADLTVDGSSVADTVIVTVKNGSVKKVQLPTVAYKTSKIKDSDGYTYPSAVYKLSLGLKTLKKGTDYTVSGDVITFKDSATFSGTGAFKAK